MSQATPNPISPPKHDIHKFRDIKPRLGQDNWMSWKWELLATARDRGLYGIIICTNLIPRETSPSASTTDDMVYIGAIPLTHLINEWNDKNNFAYNQILLCISPELQTVIDDTNQAKTTWDIIVWKYESTDPRKISIVHTRYKNYHMVKGQLVITYLTTIREYRNQLKKMGEVIADSTHAATILRNVPESWRHITQTIRMIMRIPDEIEESLEAHEADLSALEISDQAATTFITQIKPNWPNQNCNQVTNQNNSCNNEASLSFTPRTSFTCNNCRKTGHSVTRCYVLGGGLEGQAPWMKNKEPTQHIPQTFNNPPTARPNNNSLARPVEDTIQLVEQRPDTIIMMAGFNKETILSTSEYIYPMIMTTEKTPSSVDNTYLWLIDSATSSHISGNRDLFHTMHLIPLIKNDIANGESFIADQHGTINIKVILDLCWGL